MNGYKIKKRINFYILFKKYTHPRFLEDFKLYKSQLFGKSS